MADIRVVTDRFSVAPQIALEDFAQLASAGYRHIINNRPDGESPDQPSSAVIEVAAKQAGLTYVHAPFVGQPTADAVKAALSASSKTLAAGPEHGPSRRGPLPRQARAKRRSILSRRRRTRGIIFPG